MKNRRNTQLSDDALQRYINFRYSLNGLLQSDRAELAETFPRFSSRRWYRKALEQVYAAAYDSGRLTTNEMVVGAELESDFVEIAGMRDVAAGGAMDVGVAVLVRDLVDPEVYRKVTGWWTRVESAWLPQPDPEPQPAPDQDTTQDLRNVRRVPALDEQSSTGPDYPGAPNAGPNRTAPAGRPRNVILPPTVDHLPPPKMMPGQRREPVVNRNPNWPVVDRDKVRLKIAQDKAHRKAAHKRTIRSHSRRGTLFLALWLVGMFVSAFDLGGAVTPIGQLLGSSYSALFWLAAAVTCAVLSMLSFRRAASTRKMPY